MLNTVSGVSAVNGSSVYLRARGDAANERDGVPCVHPSTTAPRWDGRSVYLWTELYAKYWSDVRRQRSNSFWAARGGISSP